MLGVCVDCLSPLGRPSVAMLGELMPGPGGLIRQVLKSHPAVLAYFLEMRAAGIGIAVVVAGESLASSDYAAELAFYADWLSEVRPDLWLIGNEPKALPGSASSWVMEPDAYVELWNAGVPSVKAVIPDARCYVGGLLGLPDAWSDAVLPRLVPQPDGLDLHYPGMFGFETEAVMQAWAALGFPLSVMEESYAGDTVRRRDVIAYVKLMLKYAGDLAVFSYHPVEGVEYMALVDASGEPTKAFHDFTAAFCATMPPSGG